MIASAPGSVTDVTDDQYRALVLSYWSLGTINGPVLCWYRFWCETVFRIFPDFS
jgi:hypothetical protein